jgi:CDGSH-type Zn-finger protein
VPLKLTEKGRHALCMCKHTKDAPNCDGSHGSL